MVSIFSKYSICNLTSSISSCIFKIVSEDSIFLSKPHAKDFAEKILQAYKIKSDVLKKRVLKQNTIAKQYDFDVRAKKYSEWLDELYLKS